MKEKIKANIRTTVRHKWYTWIKLKDWPAARDSGLPTNWITTPYGHILGTELFLSMLMLDKVMETLPKEPYIQLSVEVPTGTLIQPRLPYNESTKEFALGDEKYASYVSEAKFIPGGLAILDIINAGEYRTI